MAKKVSFYGVMLAVSMLFSYIEFLFPFNFGIPGMKLGLANAVMIFLLYKYGFFSSLAINMARIALSSLLFGNVMNFLFSALGGILSLIIMSLLIKSTIFGKVGVSVGGAVAHNLGQALAAVIIMESTAVFYYLPILIILATVTGVFMGMLAFLIFEKTDNLKYFGVK